jgi:hypothetical protein
MRDIVAAALDEPLPFPRTMEFPEELTDGEFATSELPDTDIETMLRVFPILETAREILDGCNRTEAGQPPPLSPIPMSKRWKEESNSRERTREDREGGLTTHRLHRTCTRTVC